jgi:hypothetical protein
MKSTRSGKITYRSRRPLPSRTLITIRWLSMSFTCSAQTSLMRSPDPYVVITTARTFVDASASRSRVTSLPLRMSGSA